MRNGKGDHEICYSPITKRHVAVDGKIQYQTARASLLSDIGDATVVGMTDEVVARAAALLERFTLRSTDALHIACAAEWSTEPFVSADARPCGAAKVHGLKVKPISI